MNNTAAQQPDERRGDDDNRSTFQWSRWSCLGNREKRIHRLAGLCFFGAFESERQHKCGKIDGLGNMSQVKMTGASTLKALILSANYVVAAVTYTAAPKVSSAKQASSPSPQHRLTGMNLHAFAIDHFSHCRCTVSQASVKHEYPVHCLTRDTICPNTSTEFPTQNKINRRKPMHIMHSYVSATLI